nr:hypothetical protein GCM10020063_070120 [Dactylosporangium thailandense]
MRDSVFDTLLPLGIALGAALLALLAVHVVHKILVRVGRQSSLVTELALRAHRPTQWVLVLCAVYFAVRASADGASWRHAFLHADQLVIIAAAAWLLAALLVVAEDAALARFNTEVPDNRTARRVHTQVVMIRRVTVAVVAVLAVAVMLMTFPGARLLGTSVLASAGFLGIIAGLAAQSVLRNVFAGLQLAFSDAVRLGDVVIVEQEWGAGPGDHAVLRRRARVGRPAAHPPDVLLHREAVRELDPDELGAAGGRDVRRGLVAAGAGDA